MGQQISFFRRQLFVTPRPVDRKIHSLHGQTGIVTGANIGLGLEVSRQLLGLGLSTLVLAVRSIERGTIARTHLLAAYPDAEILVWEIDMASYDSVQRFVERCKTLSRLDFAVLNAGVVKFNFELNPTTKHEETIQINFLSTTLLACLLLPVIANKTSGKDQPGKITLVGSETAEWTSFKEKTVDPIIPAFDDPKNWDAGDRYYVSKLLPQFFLKEAAERVDPEKVILNTVNPGFCYGSGLHREVPGMLGFVFGVFKRAIGRSCAVGARPIVNAAMVQGKESHGRYFSDNDIFSLAYHTRRPSSDQVSARLWNELMAEFDFADVSSIIASMSNDARGRF